MFSAVTGFYDPDGGRGHRRALPARGRRPDLHPGLHAGRPGRRRAARARPHRHRAGLGPRRRAPRHARPRRRPSPTAPSPPAAPSWRCVTSARSSSSPDRAASAVCPPQVPVAYGALQNGGGWPRYDRSDRAEGETAMASFTRGFLGRGHEERDPRLPPGQYDTGRLAGADRRGHARPRHRHVDVHASRAWSSSRRRGRGTRSTPCRRRRYDGRHPLRHHVVEARHDLRRRLGRHAARRRPARCRRRRTCWRARHTGYTTNLPLADVTGGKAWVVWEVDGEPLPVEHGGPARLLVPHLYFWKSAKWVAGPAAARPRRARLLGAQRLPRPRRPLARAALPG